jgi:hypothetical protein
MNLHNEKEPTENMCLDISCILREQLLCEAQSVQEVFRIYPKELELSWNLLYRIYINKFVALPL